jgi:5-methylcytosine-specific restriction endonuclease McrBC regulatory subunit McrC
MTAGWDGVQIRRQAEGTRYYLAHRMPEDVSIIRLRPDILFTRIGSDKPILIADAKYKQITSFKISMGISEGDLYQMLAYATRLNCQKGLLLYPQNVMPIHQSIQFDKTDIVLNIHTVNLRQPLNNPKPIIQELNDIFLSLP